jgi:hypothetical protein
MLLSCILNRKPCQLLNCPILAAASGGARKKEFFGDTPNPGREAAPPAPLLNIYKS